MKFELNRVENIPSSIPAFKGSRNARSQKSLKETSDLLMQRKETEREELFRKYQRIIGIKGPVSSLKTLVRGNSNNFQENESSSSQNVHELDRAEQETPFSSKKPVFRSSDEHEGKWETKENRSRVSSLKKYSERRKMFTKTGMTLDNQSYVQMGEFGGSFQSSEPIEASMLPVVLKHQPNSNEKLRNGGLSSSSSVGNLQQGSKSRMKQGLTYAPAETNKKVESFWSVYNSLGDLNFKMVDLVSPEDDKLLSALTKERKIQAFLSIQSKRFGLIQEALKTIINSKPPNPSSQFGNKAKILVDDPATHEHKPDAFSLLGVLENELDKLVQNYSNFLLLNHSGLKESSTYRDTSTASSGFVSKQDMIDCMTLMSLIMSQYKLKDSFVTLPNGISPSEIPKKILDLKTIVKSIKFVPFSKVSDELQEVMADYSKEVESLKSRIENFERENSELKQMNQGFLMKSKKDNMKLVEINKEIMLRTTKTKEELTADIEKSFHNQIKGLEKDIKDLGFENERFRKLYTEEKEKNEKMLKTEKFDHRTFASKETQVSYTREDLMKLPMPTISSFFTNISVNLISGKPQTQEWVNGCVAAILNEKMVADFVDDFEGRPRGSLKTFVMEWFFKRIGNFSVVDQLLRDFFISIKDRAMETERFKLFVEFCGIDGLLPAKGNEAENNRYLSKLKVRQIFMRSPEALKIYFILAHHLKQLQKNKNRTPFLPNPLIRGQDFVHINTAKSLVYLVFSLEGIGHGFTLEYLNDFSAVIHHDLYYRVVEERNNGETTKESKIEEENYIRFDFLARQVLECVCDHISSKIDQFYGALNVNNYNKSESNVSWEDFYHAATRNISSRTERWAQIAYTNMMDINNSQKPPLSQLIYNMLPDFFQEREAKRNYLGVDLDEITERVSIKDILQNAKEVLKSGDKEGSGSASNPPGKSSMKPQDKKPKVTIGRKQGNFEQDANFVALINAEETIGKADIQNRQKVMEHSRSFFDCISSLGALEESYKIMKGKIKEVERNNESVMSQHQEFMELFSRYPENIQSLETFESFYGFPANDLTNATELLWRKFRGILTICYKN